jgi:glycosyltransferase involved in cell wall biosynthesis
MKLLVLIWPTNYPNYAADSVFTLNRLLIDGLLDADAGLHISVAGPPDLPLAESRVDRYSLETGVDKFRVRLDTPWSQLRETIAAVSPDVILVNMPEQAGAVAVLTKDDLGLDATIVSYVPYIPGVPVDGRVVAESAIDGAGHGQLLLMRLAEGVVASDLTLVCSKFGIDLLSRLTEPVVERGKELRIEMLAPPVDVDEAAVGFGVTTSETPLLVYNHRLYDEYGTDLVFELLAEVAERHPAFEVLVTNPTHGRGAQRRRLNGRVDANVNKLRALPFVRMRHFADRGEYFRAVGRAWAGVGPCKPNALWSMSIVDVLSTGRPVVAFDVGGVSEIGLPHDCLVRRVDQFVEAVDRVIAAGPPAADHDLRSLMDRYSHSQMARRFIELVNAC